MTHSFPTRRSSDLETGLEPECLKTLTVDCLTNAHAGTVELRYLKRRARGAEHKSMRIRDGGGGTPGGLIRRLIDVTAAARVHLPGDCLWAYHNVGDRESVVQGKSVSVRVDLGGRRIINKKNTGVC